MNENKYLEPRQSRSKNGSQIMKDKTASNKACKRQFKEKYKSIDYFGQSINLTWKGEE